jgi:hypothetical protein
MRSPLGSLPTPAEALDAPDWPAGGGFDTQPGERPRVHVARRGDVMEAEAQKKPTPPREEPSTEAKPERTGIAAFFGFSPKPTPAAEGETSDAKASRKGWWQRPVDK